MCSRSSSAPTNAAPWHTAQPRTASYYNLPDGKTDGALAHGSFHRRQQEEKEEEAGRRAARASITRIATYNSHRGASVPVSYMHTYVYAVGWQVLCSYVVSREE